MVLYVEESDVLRRQCYLLSDFVTGIEAIVNRADIEDGDLFWPARTSWRI